MEKYAKTLKIAKSLQKGSLTVMVIFFKRREINTKDDGNVVKKFPHYIFYRN